MLSRIRSNTALQLFFGLLAGIAFGFLLQKGGVTRYDILIGQLLLIDFTVVKVILTAVLVGMIGVYAMRQRGWVQLNPKPGSVGSSVLGGLVFGVGFGILGYCPGTVTGAAGQGSLDALLGGIPGILIGSRLYAALYPKLRSAVLEKGHFGKVTVPELGLWKSSTAVGIAGVTILVVLVVIEGMGL